MNEENRNEFVEVNEEVDGGVSNKEIALGSLMLAATFGLGFISRGKTIKNLRKELCDMRVQSELYRVGATLIGEVAYARQETINALKNTIKK